MPGLNWHYGPTADNPDPGRRWHYDCGGEVMLIDDGEICMLCDAQSDDGSGSETLADWLRRAIERDAEIAQQIVDRDSWHGIHVDSATVVATHINRHDPARVLRDVAAKRALLDRELLFDADSQPQCQGHPGPWMNHGEYGPGYCRDYSDNWTVRLLAQSYRGEPGWREEWAVD